MRPCTPCSEEGGVDCVYEKSRIKQRTRKKPLAIAEDPRSSSTSESSPCSSSPSRVSCEGLPLSALNVAPFDDCGTVFSVMNHNSPNVYARGHNFREFDTLDEFGPPGIGSITETKLMPSGGGYSNPSQPATIPTFSFLPSLRFPIPRQLYTQLSLFSPEHFQVSVVTTSLELDWALCVFPPFGHHS